LGGGGRLKGRRTIGRTGINGREFNIQMKSWINILAGRGLDMSGSGEG